VSYLFKNKLLRKCIIMIYNYKLYIFDLDGTIIDSEYSHYLAYNKQLGAKITFNVYEKIFHDEKQKNICINVNNICKTKKENDFMDIYKSNKKMISGFEDFFYELLEKGKEVIIVTNSTDERMKYILNEHPILNKAFKIITKNQMKYPKPNPECYIKIINDSKFNMDEIIIFEDSYTGYEAIKNIEVEKSFICKNDYYYFNEIKSLNKYENYIELINCFAPKYDFSFKHKFLYYNNKYIETLTKNNENLFKVHNLLKCIIKTNKQNVYFIGVGKSNSIANKCAATWRSLGVPIHSLNCEDVLHGSFGIFKSGDLILYLTNSGNTNEVIYIANHFKNNFNCTQVCLTCNENNKINGYVDYTFVLTNDLSEIGNIQKAPTVSSFLFMNFLDTLGVMITDDIVTPKLFTTYHPGGTLGINKFDYVVISACGKGTRLKPITNHIPKLLVNVGNDNILTMQIKYWKKYVNKFLVIIEKEYNQIVEFYLKMHNVNYVIKNVEITNNEENAYTLQSSLNNYQEIMDKSIIITWCDIIMNEELDLTKLNNENIIFTYGENSRYYCEPNTIYKKKNGNVIGCYFIRKMKKIINDNIKNDFCDIFLKNFNFFNVYKLKILIDVGDMSKLDDFILNSNLNYKTRFFNKIEEISDEKIIKKCVDVYGKEKIRIEMKYYKYISQYKLNFPKIFSYGEDYFIMENFDKTISLNKMQINENVIDLIIKNISKIHNSKYIHIDNKKYISDLETEFRKKIIDRINEVIPIISWIKPKKINNIDIKNDFNYIIKDLYEKIYEKLKYNNEYNLIHGDCQFSNMLYNEYNNEIYFIDPRGYFGETLFFGIKEYDYSKLLYAISGYDNFNNDDKYYFSFENNNLITNINCENILAFKNTFKKNNIDFELCMYMTIIHWLGLSSYNKNNISKCIASYYQGVFLYNKYC